MSHVFTDYLRMSLARKYCLFRQVDDFALRCDSEETAEKVWKLINAKMSAPFKREGLLH